ncbi:hypothetical protein GCM10027059_50580 [Myceligenerans halotolerans]
MLRPDVDEVEELVERAAPVNIREEYVLSREAARAGVREVLADLADGEFERHWAGLEQAAVQRQRFALDEDGQEADGAAAADLCGVDIEDFRGFDAADRAGEGPGAGYDWPALSEAVADAWGEVLRERASAAVRARARTTHGGEDGATAAA